MVMALGLSCCSAALVALGPAKSADKAIAVAISLTCLMVSSRDCHLHVREWLRGASLRPYGLCSRNSVALARRPRDDSIEQCRGQYWAPSDGMTGAMAVKAKPRNSRAPAT